MMKPQRDITAESATREILTRFTLCYIFYSHVFVATAYLYHNRKKKQEKNSTNKSKPKNAVKKIVHVTCFLYISL